MKDSVATNITSVPLIDADSPAAIDDAIATNITSVHPFDANSPAPEDLAGLVKNACQRFADAWEAAGTDGVPPRIAAYLEGSAEPVRPALLEELVTLDINRRRQRGEQPKLEDYKVRFPDLALPAVSARLAKEAPWSFLTPAIVDEPDTLGWLGFYRVEKLLGQGGMGMVFLAEDTRLQRFVALKVIKPELNRDLNAQLRFIREARALAAVKHENVVTVYQVGTESDVAYLAMEFLEGQSLGDWLKHGDRPSVHETVLLGRQIASGLAAAHARGLIHRDVKPSNIWLESRGNASDAPRVKLLDFGLVLPAVAELLLTRDGCPVGTPAYMSPEQARAEPLDLRADLFSLGCVIYQLCTGRHPFVGRTRMAVLASIAADIPTPVHELNPEVPLTLSALVNRLLAKNPVDRPSSVGEVISALQAIEAILAKPAPADSTAEYGSPQGASRRPRAPERRQVTVLICRCDMFESKAFLETLDSAGQAKTLRAFEKACSPAIRRNGGSIIQLDHEGLLACFGYPVAHEDAARRAAQAGMELLANAKHLAEKLRRVHKLELQPCVGLHTGPALVETKDDGISLVGEVRNVVVRLSSGLEPNRMVCTEATRRMIRGQSEFVSLGLHTIKGLAQPIELFRLEGLSAASSPIETAARDGLTPLIGRDNCVGLLKERWQQALDGMGQIVLITGEPGLGKSRLVYTMKQFVLGQMVEGEVDAPVIEWRCSPQYQNSEFFPAIDFCEKSLGIDREAPPEERLSRVLQRLKQYGLDRPETVPLWASLLSLPIPDTFPPLTLSPIRQREETFRMMLEWLHVRAVRKPVLFVVEDLHWVDATTLEFLRQFLAEGLHERILTILTFRPEFREPWPTVAHQTSLALQRLTRRQVGDLMRSKLGSDLPDGVVGQVFDRTRGVPLFVEEFTKMVQEAGATDATRQALIRHEIPATLQDLLMARLNRMEGEREVALLAATIGREFNYELLAAAADRDDSTLQTELAQLVQLEILYPKGRPPRCIYIFKHALLEDALYGALVKGKRQQFHRRIADALEARFAQTIETQPELLAHHLTEAGQTEKAVGFWLKAGMRSRQRSAEVEVIGHVNKGLALLKTLSESTARDAQELQLLSVLHFAYQATKGYSAPELEPLVCRERELCERIGEPAQQFAGLWANWAFHMVRGEFRLCMVLSTEAMEIAEKQQDKGIMLEALTMPGATLYYRADFAAALTHFDRALADYDDRERSAIWVGHNVHDAGITHRGYRALTLWHLGFADQARKQMREMVELARATKQPFSLALALHYLAWLSHTCGLGADAKAAGEEEARIAAEQGNQWFNATGTLFKAAGLLLEGRTSEGLPLLNKGLEIYRATGAWLAVPYYLGIQGAALMAAGQFDAARRSLDEALALVEKNDDRFREAELYRLKGELLLAESGDEAGAADCFQRAIETASRQKSMAWELRATVSLARLWQKQGHATTAHAAVAAVFGRFTEGFSTPDLVDAAVLLRALA